MIGSHLVATTAVLEWAVGRQSAMARPVAGQLKSGKTAVQPGLPDELACMSEECCKSECVSRRWCKNPGSAEDYLDHGPKTSHPGYHAGDLCEANSPSSGDGGFE